MRFLEVVVALAVKEFEQRRPKLTSRERRKINSRTHMYLFMKASRVVLRGVWFREKPLTYVIYRIIWETKYGRFTTLNILKCEHFTLLVCPLQFLVIPAMRRLRDVQSFKTYMFSLGGYPTLRRLHGKLSPWLTGLPYPADRATHLSCKRDQDKIRNYMDRRVTPPGQVTSPTWGPPPPCKKALRVCFR